VTGVDLPAVPGVTMRKGGIVASASEALSEIKDRAIVAISGFNMATTPEYLIRELYELYTKTGHPRDLFVIGDALPAIPGKALDAVAKRIYENKDTGFLRGISIPFLGFSPYLQKLVTENMLEAYSWPMGVAAYWFREVASGRPGIVSKIGIDTAIDPRKDGGKLNQLARTWNTCQVRRIEMEGDEYLLYEAPKPTVALVRATSADRRGSLTLEDEPIRGTVLNIVQATKAHPDPGIVIAQVKRLRPEESPPRTVEVPGPFVDFLVVSPEMYHWQSGSTAYDPSFGNKAVGKSMIPEVAVEPTDLAIARRVLIELVEAALKKGSPLVVNLGIGIPALVSRVAREEGVEDYIISVLESGQWGGLALAGIDFGVAVGPFALSTMPDMFSNFEGGTIDAASLGFLQVGENGDVNPSMLPNRLYGPGGFPVIAGGSPRIYFAGGFTAGRSELKVERGRLKIVKDGDVMKFVDDVYKNFFSGKQALRFGKDVLYVTERAVFRLTPGGLKLIEIAPGIDLDKDVLGHMQFKPMVDKDVSEMHPEIFGPKPMGLSRRIWAQD
jgi:acyl CoA:acetate/3-ketoacid CoA transferase